MRLFPGQLPGGDSHLTVERSYYLAVAVPE